MSLTLASEHRRSYITPIVIAATVLLVAIGAAFYFNPHRQADLTASHTEIFAPQTTFKQQAAGMHIIGAAPEIEKDLYAVVTVRLQDQLRLPLFIDEIDGKYVATDGSEMDAVSPAASDLERLEGVFPQLKPLLPHPLLMGDTVLAKASMEGQVLLHFAGLSEQDWKLRKPSTLTIHFTHQDPITVTIP